MMHLREIVFFAVGICFLAMAKIKHMIQGYYTPKPFDISDAERCIDYDINVVENWLLHLKNYGNGASILDRMNVLELGPGSDLGIGLYLLSKGCSQYWAVDVHDLMKSTPDEFYDRLLDKLESDNDKIDKRFLRDQLRMARAQSTSCLNYIVRADFDIVSAVGKSTIDLVFSQAAFEHFDDIQSTISQLSSVCKRGATLVVEVDLATHSRWIRDKDPNNIYRYSKSVYDVFSFRGIPNRMRPYQYREALEHFGWGDIRIIALAELNRDKNAYSGLHKAFLDEKNQMNMLSIMICATKVAE